jgi:hypothetical protein
LKGIQNRSSEVYRQFEEWERWTSCPNDVRRWVSKQTI